MLEDSNVDPITAPGHIQGNEAFDEVGFPQLSSKIREGVDNQSIAEMREATEALAVGARLPTLETSQPSHGMSYADFSARALEAYRIGAWRGKLVRQFEGSTNPEVHKTIGRMFLDAIRAGTLEAGDFAATCCAVLPKDADAELRRSICDRLVRINFGGWGIREFFKGTKNPAETDALISIYSGGNTYVLQECLDAFAGNPNENAFSDSP